MAIGDFHINSRVRGVFAKHWLDTSQLSVVTIKGNVYLGGTVRKLLAVSRDIVINEELMETIDFEITRINGVKRVTYRLEEWRREGGKFIMLAARRAHKQEEREKSREIPERASRDERVRRDDGA